MMVKKSEQWDDWEEEKPKIVETLKQIKSM
jgi:hypothetical protein